MGLEERKKSKDIDGVTYEVTPLQFSIGRQALTRLTKVLSHILPEILNDKEDENRALANAFRKLPEAISDDDIEYFVKTFGPTSSYRSGNGNMVPMVPQNLELHFAGNYTAFFKWIAFCVEVNFGGFFGELLGGKLLGASA